MSSNDGLGMLGQGVDWWNEAVSEIGDLLFLTPENYMGGAFWSISNNIYIALQAVAIPLVAMFFLWGFLNTIQNTDEIRRPEFIVKPLVRLIIAQALVVSGINIILWIWSIGLQVLSSINSGLGGSGLTAAGNAFKVSIPESIVEEYKKINGMFSFIGNIGTHLIVFVVSFILLACSWLIKLTVYSRFMRMYIYICLAPIAMAGFASKDTDFMTKTFFRNFMNLALQNAGIYLAIVIYSAFIGNIQVAEGTSIMGYSLNLGFQCVILVVLIQSMDALINKITGL